MLNLINDAAKAEQSSFDSSHSQTAVSGCDGDMIEIDIVLYNWDPTKIVCSATFSDYWKVTFQ